MAWWIVVPPPVETGSHQVTHLLLTPLQFFVGRGRYRNEHRHIEQVLIPAGESLLDVVTGLDRASQFLIVSGGVLQFSQFGAVEPDALGHSINGLTTDLAVQMQIHIYALACIDE